MALCAALTGPRSAWGESGQPPAPWTLRQTRADVPTRASLALQFLMEICKIFLFFSLFCFSSL